MRSVIFSSVRIDLSLGSKYGVQALVVYRDFSSLQHKLARIQPNLDEDGRQISAIIQVCQIPPKILQNSDNVA